MATGRALLTVHLDGLQVETLPLQWQWSLPAAILERVTVTGTGDLTLSIPTGTSFIIIEPPTTSSVALKVKQAGGETGITIAPNEPCPLRYGSGAVLINRASSVTLTITYV